MSKHITRYKHNGKTLFRVYFGMLGYRVRKQGFTSRREAETWYMRMRHLISSGQYEKYLDDESKKKEVDNKLSVRKAAEMTLFVDKVSGLRPRTIRTYRQHYLKWVDPVLGNKDIRYLKKSDYEKVFRAQEKAGRKQSSHNIPLIALNWIQKKIAGLGIWILMRFQRRSGDP